MKKTIKYIIGVDAGKSGAISIYNTQDESMIFFKMPETPLDIFQILEPYSEDSFAFLEKVGGRPMNGGSRAFNFGKLYGYMEMSLIAWKIPYETITAIKWQKIYQLTPGKCYTEHKNLLKTKAQQLFPELKITLWNCDAILLMEYGKHEFLKRI